MDITEHQKITIESVVESNNYNDLEYPEFIFYYLYLRDQKLADTQVDTLLTLSNQQLYHFIIKTNYGFNHDGSAFDTSLPQMQLKKIKERYDKLDQYYKKYIKYYYEEQSV